MPCTSLPKLLLSNSSYLFLSNDSLSHYIALEEIHSPKIRSDFVKLRQFLAWKFNVRTLRLVSLEQGCLTDFLYSQREMQKYEQNLLQRYWENQSDHKNCELLSASLLSKTNIKRSTEVFIFQLFTGHCQLKGFLYKAWKAESPLSRKLYWGEVEVVEVVNDAF